ncbi:MAG: 3-deoxy-D-manno-octulosonic acid transferase, partial [Polynucleobacter victoriensis]
ASLTKSFPQVARRSLLGTNTDLATAINQQGILLGDSMGEMSFYYALSDFVVMGGSLQPLGGQNFIEACALGRPIILGQHTFNFQQASIDVIDAEAGLRVDGVDGLSQAIGLLFLNHELKEAMSTNALDFANQHTGATQKILAIVQASH